MLSWVLELAGRIRAARAAADRPISVKPKPCQCRPCGQRANCGQAKFRGCRHERHIFRIRTRANRNSILGRRPVRVEQTTPRAAYSPHSDAREHKVRSSVAGIEPGENGDAASFRVPAAPPDGGRSPAGPPAALPRAQSSRSGRRYAVARPGRFTRRVAGLTLARRVAGSDGPSPSGGFVHPFFVALY